MINTLKISLNTTNMTFLTWKVESPYFSPPTLYLIVKYFQNYKDLRINITKTKRLQAKFIMAKIYI